MDLILPSLPGYVPIVFALTTLVTLVVFLYVLSKSLHGTALWLTVAGIGGWLALQAALSLSGFYATDTRSVPPRFFLALAPTLVAIALLFLTKGGKAFLDRMPLTPLHYLHTVRIPVEVVLYWLFLGGAVPILMTFAGRNFDILAGVTAPIVAYFGLQRKLIGRLPVLMWNFVCLGLVTFIVVNAILAAPLAFQQIAFDQPNVAVAFFPYIWLPSFVVPVVFLSHLVAIRRLLQNPT